MEACHSRGKELETRKLPMLKSFCFFSTWWVPDNVAHSRHDDWLIDWLIHWLVDWLIDWMNEWSKPTFQLEMNWWTWVALPTSKDRLPLIKVVKKICRCLSKKFGVNLRLFMKKNDVANNLNAWRIFCLLVRYILWKDRVRKSELVCVCVCECLKQRKGGL